MASLIHDTSPILRHSLQQSHNKGLYYGFRDAILSGLVTIASSAWCIMRYTVYPCLASCTFYAIPIYIPFLIYEILYLLVSFHFFTAFSSESYKI